MARETPGWSDFRELLDTWDEAVEGQEKKDIEALVDKNDFVLFFVKNGSVFGAPEESRMTFARMKNPDEDDDEMWMKEASFMGFNLERALSGEQAEAVFSYKDMKTIQVIDREEAIRRLVARSAKLSPETKKGLLTKPKSDPNVPDNMDQVDEK